MKLYEITYLISPDLSEEELRDFQEKIISFIQEQGGILGKTNSVTKKTLAYPIKKKEIAFFVNLDFQLQPEKIEILEKKLKKESKILRYLILRKELPKKVMIRPLKRPKRILKTKPKVELKEIEKKLEEILGE